ncbi:MAG: hypothetical protein H0W24_03030 [Lysobacter sp.]|nr:hypothetical protein [Lysobacter sp.]MDQ3269512.1 hypothetical protein [Pseudomonadota bacterium]
MPGLPWSLRRTLRIDAQAQFNPYDYTRGPFGELVRRGAMAHEHSAVIDVDARAGVVRTARRRREPRMTRASLV